MTQYSKFFGEMTDEMLEMGMEESPFFDEVGNEYEYEIQYHPEGDGNGFIRITDSIGRMVPIDCAHLRELIDALLEVETATGLERLRHSVLTNRNW